MNIIKINANENGSRPPLQHWNDTTIPDGYAICPDKFYSIFYLTSPAGFVDIEVEDDVVVAMKTNQKALENYFTSIPEDVMTPEKEIAELKCKLAATDYHAIKYAEGVISDEEYADMKAQRQAWRDRINELERAVGGGA